jgi:hypothetical protein
MTEFHNLGKYLRSRVVCCSVSLDMLSLAVHILFCIGNVLLFDLSVLGHVISTGKSKTKFIYSLTVCCNEFNSFFL